MRFALRLIFLSLNGGFDIESPKCSTTNKTGQILLLDVITTIFDLMVGLFSGKRIAVALILSGWKNPETDTFQIV